MLYPNVGDVALAAVFALPHGGPLSDMKRVWQLWAVVAVAVTVLMPTMAHVWLSPGAGNANYYFNMVQHTPVCG